MSISPPGMKPQKVQTACNDCPLHTMDAFREFTPDQLKFVQGFKSGEMVVEAGSTLLLEANNSAHLFTVLSGWIFRYKTLEDGRRQILNFGLPGDFVGLQSSVFDQMDHSVEALTDVVLCTFPRDKVWTLFKSQPGLGFDLTWIAAREERALNEKLLSLGRRTAIERIAYTLLDLYVRLERLKMANNRSGATFPFTQQHLADALGLSPVHISNTLKKLTVQGMIRWKAQSFRVADRNKLAEVAGYEFDLVAERPFI